jgi:cytochrome c peroxidase
MKKLTLLVLLCATVAVFSCKKEKEITGNSTVVLDLPATPYDYFGGNPQENAKATLGRVLFYDRHLSINNSIACASCHRQELAFADNLAGSRGFENRITSRNSMAIQNLNINGMGGGVFFVGGTSLFWDGRENNINNLIRRPIANHVEMGIDDLGSLPAKLAQLPYYSKLFTEAFGSDEITVDNLSTAVATFLAAINSTNTRFDQATNGTGQTHLTGLELQGQSLFNTKYECTSCHQPSIGGYSSTEFMNIGLDYQPMDKGRAAITNDPSDVGRFKIPNLRNVALTAPYMHDGRFSTLDAVLEHYSHGIQKNTNLDARLRTANGDAIRMNISPDSR